MEKTENFFDMIEKRSKEILESYWQSEEYLEVVRREGSYLEYMKQYYTVEKNQYHYKPNKKKQSLFEDFKKELETIQELDLAETTIQKLDVSGKYAIIMRYEMLIASPKYEVFNMAEFMSRLCYYYQDFRIEVAADKQIVMTFNVKTYDAIKMKDSSLELEELNRRMLLLSKEDRRK